MAFPTTLTNAVDGVTQAVAAHINNLESKVGVDGSLVTTSLDNLVKAAENPGHTHTPAAVGLGNVTNDAQVKKISSSISGNLVTWSGTGGDIPADSGIAATDVAVSNLNGTLSAGQWKGTTEDFTVSGTVAVGDLVQLVSSTGLKVAISDVSTDVPAIGICVATDSTTRTILVGGRYKFTGSQSWTAPSIICRHATSDGDMQENEPSSAGQKIQRLGISLAADEIWLNPSMDVGTV